MRVYAFVGPSGTGKSYRAQMVAGENNIEFNEYYDFYNSKVFTTMGTWYSCWICYC